MALTRKMLAAMDIPAEKIDEIINAHMETVNPLKEERDSLKAELEPLRSVKQDLEKANKDLEELKGKDWEKKYNDLKGEYDNFKSDTAKKEEKNAKESAYRQLLLDAGVSEKRVASVMRVSNMDDIKLGTDGKIVDADKVTEGVKKEWADFIAVKETHGAKTSTPPDGDGDAGKKSGRAAELVAKYNSEHYGNGSSNKEV